MHNTHKHPWWIQAQSKLHILYISHQILHSTYITKYPRTTFYSVRTAFTLMLNIKIMNTDNATYCSLPYVPNPIYANIIATHIPFHLSPYGWNPSTLSMNSIHFSYTTMACIRMKWVNRELDGWLAGWLAHSLVARNKNKKKERRVSVWRRYQPI